MAINSGEFVWLPCWWRPLSIRGSASWVGTKWHHFVLMQLSWLSMIVLLALGNLRLEGVLWGDLKGTDYGQSSAKSHTPIIATFIIKLVCSSWGKTSQGHRDIGTQLIQKGKESALESLTSAFKIWNLSIWLSENAHCMCAGGQYCPASWEVWLHYTFTEENVPLSSVVSL